MYLQGFLTVYYRSKRHSDVTLVSVFICKCTSKKSISNITWAASSEFGTYCLCEQRRFRRACASAQSRQNLRYSLIQAVNQEEPSDRKPDPWPLWMAGHAQLKFVITECSKTQIRLMGLTFWWWYPLLNFKVKRKLWKLTFINKSYV